MITDRKMVSQATQLYELNTFASGTDSWLTSSGTVTATGGQLVKSQTGSTIYVYKSYTTTVGEDYMVAITAANGTTSGLSAVIDGTTYALTTGVTNYFRFTATTTSSQIRIKPTSGSGSYTYYVQDVLIKQRTKYDAVEVMRTDYYPFGMAMPGRTWNNGDYRYGYNGMELDNEIKGNGNSYTTEFRQYDPRLGRWLSLDPLMGQFPWMSPYVAFDDNPVWFTDPLGLVATGGGDGVGKIHNSVKGAPENPEDGAFYTSKRKGEYQYIADKGGWLKISRAVVVNHKTDPLVILRRELKKIDENDELSFIEKERLTTKLINKFIKNNGHEKLAALGSAVGGMRLGIMDQFAILDPKTWSGAQTQALEDGKALAAIQKKTGLTIIECYAVLVMLKEKAAAENRDLQDWFEFGTDKVITIATAGEAGTLLESGAAKVVPGETGGSWAKTSGILRDASKYKGNFGLGSGTIAEAMEAGEAWVGEGYKIASDGKTMVSSDGLRQFRPPTVKPKLGKVQANFEWRNVAKGAWQGNGHLDIIP